MTLGDIEMLLAIQQDPTPTGFGLERIVLFAGLAVAYYFVFVRPLRRRRQQRLSLAQAIGVGDRVRTASGLYGEVVSLTDDTVVLRLVEGRAEFDRRAIAHRFGSDDAS